MRLQMLLPSTLAYEELLRELQMNSISEEFYTTDAMINKYWMQAEYEMRPQYKNLQ